MSDRWVYKLLIGIEGWPLTFLAGWLMADVIYGEIVGTTAKAIIVCVFIQIAVDIAIWRMGRSRAE